MKVYIPRILEICKLLRKEKIKKYCYDYGYRDDIQIIIYKNNKISFQSENNYYYFKVKKDGSVNFPRNQQKRYSLRIRDEFFHKFYIELKYFNFTRIKIDDSIKKLLIIISNLIEKYGKQLYNFDYCYKNTDITMFTNFQQNNKKEFDITIDLKSNRYTIEYGYFIKYYSIDPNYLEVPKFFIKNPGLLKTYLKKIMLIIISKGE